MQIVIDIPEEYYEKVIKTIPDWQASADTLMIKNGTPLPKGHGRLLDEKEVYKKFYCRCLAGVAKEVFEETSTIIEADGGDAE